MSRGSFAVGNQQAEVATPLVLPPKPTEEQQLAVDLFNRGGSLTIKALAGTGKSTTLALIAASAPSRRGQYVVFNKAMSDAAKSKMPPNVNVNTLHSLAAKATAPAFRGRINQTTKLRELAKAIGVKTEKLTSPGFQKTLEAWQIAAHVGRAVNNFCLSDATAIGVEHFSPIAGIPKAIADDFHTDLLVAANKLWDDQRNPRGKLTFNHGHYFKMWELGRPLIDADFVLVDEAQDLSSVMLSVIGKQDAQIVNLVGDQFQSIYSFIGAKSAIDAIRTDHTTTLTQSFRSGSAVVAVANRILARLDADMELRPLSIDDHVGTVASPNIVLCRSNVAAVDGFLAAPTTTHLMGGSADLIATFSALGELKAGGRTNHPQLWVYESYVDLRTSLAIDPDPELERLADLVDQHGADKLVSCLRNMPSLERAARIFSTAHKAKGLEFDTVRIAGDFRNRLTPRCELCRHTAAQHIGDWCIGCDQSPAGGAPIAKRGCRQFTGAWVDPEELRLAYVAVTRAKKALDVTTIGDLL